MVNSRPISKIATPFSGNFQSKQMERLHATSKSSLHAHALHLVCVLCPCLSIAVNCTQVDRMARLISLRSLNSLSHRSFFTLGTGLFCLCFSHRGNHHVRFFCLLSQIRRSNQRILILTSPDLNPGSFTSPDSNPNLTSMMPVLISDDSDSEHLI